MKLIRYAFNQDGILGHLYDAEGNQVACTMEHSYNGLPKLKAGTYRCARGMHKLEDKPGQPPRNPFETFEIMDVPHCTGILFHPGNWQGDSRGCVLVGRTHTTSAEGCMITNSRVTFNRFMLDLEGVESFTLTVEDGVPT